ncbi:hypothetical protein PIN31009_05542 [Pandoraea iniqua]|uniref:hypothetical protein n=1 Tax=Pandoraea iniqua TaxID=2508288 RepID=UPI00123F166B|nr:hypothetical protein [Pandoraea iniqua]VVE59459.1 hypothetical protein PIN31009_05542 [Pandoraea iniqua]
MDIDIVTPTANRKELAEAFGQNQTAVRRLEDMTRDIRVTLPDAVGQVDDTAQKALDLAEAIQQLAFVILGTVTPTSPNAKSLTQGEGISITTNGTQVVISLTVPVLTKDGGTGLTNIARHAVMIGADADPVRTVSPTSIGQMLVTTGPTSDPAFSNKADLINGTVQGCTVTTGTIDNTPIGATVPASGAFSSVTAGEAARLMSTSVSLANAAGAAAGTLTNAPVAGNPTKWITINDNGVARRIPSW